MPDIIPSGDFMIYVASKDTRNGSNELIAMGKVYVTTKRSAGSNTATPMDFMNLQWKPFLHLLPEIKVNERKIENHTIHLDESIVNQAKTSTTTTTLKPKKVSG